MAVPEDCKNPSEEDYDDYDEYLSPEDRLSLEAEERRIAADFWRPIDYLETVCEDSVLFGAHVLGDEPSASSGGPAIEAASCGSSPEAAAVVRPSLVDSEILPWAWGTTVRVHGLVRTVDMNGMIGVVHSYKRETGRYEVFFDDEEFAAIHNSYTKYVKPINLVKVRDPSDDECWNPDVEDDESISEFSSCSS